MTQKDLEKTKYELSDVMDQKFSEINIGIQNESKDFKDIFSELTTKLT